MRQRGGWIVSQICCRPIRQNLYPSINIWLDPSNVIGVGHCRRDSPSKKVGAARLDSDSVGIPEALSDFCDIDALWKSRDDFLARGGGMAVLHEGQVVSWCVADLALEDVVEVGIITLPA